MKESFVLYLSFWEPVKDLPREQKGELLEAIFNYQLGNDMIVVSPHVKMAMSFFKSQFRRDDEKYSAIVEKRRDSGKKGAEITNSGKCRRTSAISSKCRQNPAKSAVSDNVSVSDNDTLILSGDVSPVCALFSFEHFWKEYNKPSDKIKCQSAFKKLSDADLELIQTRLPGYIASTPEVKYRKNPLTYLNGKCWNDEPPATEPERRLVL